MRPFMVKLLGLNNEERYAFRLHLGFAILEGVMLGVLALNEFVFLRSLNGSHFHMGFLFQFKMIAFLFLIFLNEFLKRIKNRRKFLRWTAIFTRLPVFVLLLFPHTQPASSGNSIYHFIFLAVFLIYFMGSPIVKPTINLFLKANYRHANFGKLYGYATSANKVSMLVVTLLYGLLLDYDIYAYTYILPAAGLLNIVAIFLLAEIPYSPKKPMVASAGFFQGVRRSALRMFNIVRYNKPYRDFELSFMLYGFAFMMTVTVIYIYFEDVLQLNYSSMAFYRNAYNILAIVFLPFFGKLLGNIDPRRYALITYSSVLLFLITIALSQVFQTYTVVWGIQIYFILLLYIFFRGAFAGSMPLLWNIGSAYFCQSDDADIYQSIHLSLTGLRSLLAPVLGVYFYETYGLNFTVAVSSFLLLAAMVLLIFSYRKRYGIGHYKNVS
ncbi:MAG: MFS transporter [Bacteroidales bacterium]|nr:MFS transporter [Bacteroidales bacterium]